MSDNLDPNITGDPPPETTRAQRPTFTPPTPIMGGLHRVSDNEIAAWTGGKPKHDWSGLDPSARSRPKGPNQLRSYSVGTAQKSHVYRRTGRASKFKRTQDLRAFELQIWKHMVNTGMDTIAYVPDPVDKERMTNCVLEHSRFSVASVRTKIAAQLIKYDDFDQANDSEATEYLLDSLDVALARELQDICEDTDPFPVVYLHLIKLIRSVSIDRFEHLKVQIKARRPDQYPGQDLALLAADFRKDARELEIAGQYDHNLTLHMIDAFLEAGGPGNEDFRFPLRGLKATLNERLLELGYLSRDDANALMARESLTYKDVCTRVLDVYRSQVDNKRWPPAQHARDSKAPPPAFGAVATTDFSKIAAEVYALVQQNSSKSATATSRPSNRHGQNIQRTRKHQKGDRKAVSYAKNRKSASSNWKYEAPSASEASTKVVEGLTWHWCKICKRWSTTHGTDQHTGTSKENSGAKLQANSLVFNPAAWHVDLTSPLSWTELFSLPWSYCLSFFGVTILLLAPMVALLLNAPVSLWTLLAPITWIVTLYFSFECGRRYGNLPPAPPMPALPQRPCRRRYPRHFELRRRVLRRSSLSPVALNAKEKSRLDAFSQDIEFHLIRDRNSRATTFREACTLYKPSSKRSLKVSARNKSHARYKPSCDKQKAFEELISRSLPAYYLGSPSMDPKFTSNALKATLTSPFQAQSTLSPSEYFPVIWDSGASVTVTPHRSDFTQKIKRPSIVLRLQGIGRGIPVAGVGEVAWSFPATDGTLRTLKVPAYYVPEAKARLLSTSSLLATYPGETITQVQDRMILSGLTTSDCHTKPVEILLDRNSNLPVGHAYGPSATQSIVGAFANTVTTVEEANINLTPAQKELLRWHFKLGHLNCKKIQFLMRTGTLAHSSSAKRLQQTATSLSHFPLCTACQYGKQRRRSAPGLKSQVVRDRSGALKDNKLYPGQRVSVDHFICSTRGRLTTSRGKESPSHQYTGGCIFVDHASGYIFVEPQSHLNSHETLKAKESFEAHCHDFGVLPQEYLSDNGSAFTSHAFREHLARFQQVASYAGVGAHHHNGVAERSIQTVLSIARTMMLHAAIHWPDVADPQLWPLAVHHAVYLHNHVPDPSNGVSPSDLFTRTRWPHSRFHDLHVWGCPVYVLDKSIADGKKLPRWQPRSHRYVYVGVSGDHASSVPLVLNLSTGAITPQFHVVFDDWFATVTSHPSSLPDFGTPAWQKLFGDSSYQYVSPDEDYTLEDITTLHDLLPSRVESAAAEYAPPIPLSAPVPPLSNPIPSVPAPPAAPSLGGGSEDPAFSPDPLPVVTPPAAVTTPVSIPPNPPLPSEPVDPPAPIDVPPQQREPQQREPQQREQQRETVPPTPVAKVPPTPVAISPAPVPTPSPRRSTRTRRAPARLGFDGSQGFGYSISICRDEPYGLPAGFSLDLSLPRDSPFEISEDPSFALFKARAVKDPDTLTYEEAMSSTDREHWIAAAQKEIDGLVAQGTWVEVPSTDAKTKILPGTWVFRKKRSPSGEFKKYKARYCVRGDLQETDDETFAPVVAWSAVRLFLVLSIILKWTTCSIDFSNAFVQATLETPVWIHLPRGFRSTRGVGTCLKLLKSLYGLATAPRLWYEHLLAALRDLGFIPCQHEPCLLIRRNMMLVLYVDDAGIAAENPLDIEQLIQDLQKKGFALTKEGSFSEFLGIKFEETSKGTIKLTQTGLIDKIIKATGLENSNPNLLPTTQLALGSDPTGEPMKETWNYPSIIGMLLYLSTNTRVDIAFAVSQVARFSSAPKQSHATAVKSIVRYLKRTRNEGTILKPTGELKLDLYVDADFAGLHNSEPDLLPDAVRSRTGYVIFLSDCPLLWKSQLQPHLSCSTLEAEYAALSYSLKTLLPLKRLLLEVVAALDVPHPLQSSIRATVFEDNQGALCLATNQRLTNRTKYFLVKWHWFWEHAREFNIQKISSQEQRADFLTKGLPRQSFERNRFLVQRW